MRRCRPRPTRASSGVLGVGQHQRPAVGVDDLHAVDEHDLAVARPARRSRASPRPCAPTASAPSRARRGPSGSVAHDRRQRPVDRGEQVEQLHQRGRGVVGGQEVGPDEPAVLRRRRTSTSPSPRDLHEAARRRASSTRSSAPRSSAMRSASWRDRHRQRDARRPGRASRDERDEREQRLLGRERRALRRRRSSPVSPSGSITKPRSLPDARTSSPSALDAASSRSSTVDAADACSRTGSPRAPRRRASRARVGITIDAAPNE